MLIKRLETNKPLGSKRPISTLQLSDSIKFINNAW